MALLNLKKLKRIKPGETILDEERFMYKEEILPRRDVKSEEAGGGIEVDYLKKPHPIQGPQALFASVMGFLFTAAGLVLMYKAEGRESMLIAVLAFCSVIWSLAGEWIGIKGLMEKNRNYSMSFAAMGIGAILIIFWMIVILLGNKS